MYLTYRQQLTTLRYRKFIKSFSVSSIRKRTIFVYHYESILLLPTAVTEFAEILIRYVDVYIFHQSLYTYFRLVPSCFNRFALSHIRCFGIFAYVTKIETVNVRVSTHCKVLSGRVLLIIYVVIYQK